MPPGPRHADQGYCDAARLTSSGARTERPSSTAQLRCAVNPGRMIGELDVGMAGAGQRRAARCARDRSGTGAAVHGGLGLGRQLAGRKSEADPHRAQQHRRSVSFRRADIARGIGASRRSRSISKSQPPAATRLPSRRPPGAPARLRDHGTINRARTTAIRSFSWSSAY